MVQNKSGNAGKKGAALWLIREKWCSLENLLYKGLNLVNWHGRC